MVMPNYIIPKPIQNKTAEDENTPFSSDLNKEGEIV
jgi:hypothetical protein